MSTLTPPDLTGLADAIAASAALLARVDEARNGQVSEEGGDVSAHGSSRLVTRHVGNYLAALDLARRFPAHGAVVDVGSGVGALGAWVADELDAPLCLVDRAETARVVASRAFPHARVEADIERVERGGARLVTAMEVIEHVTPREQPKLLRQLAELVAPGGLLVLSTPDESGYAGGWSGYAPHVGPLAYAELVALLGRNLPWPVEVWRLEGKPFDLGPLRATAEPIVNRAWSALESRAPAATERTLRAASRLARLRPGARRDARAGAPEIHVGGPEGKGTGLLGVARRPPA